jgi:hypothetical protein
MNFLKEVHEHTWIKKNSKYFLYMNFHEDFRECMSMEEFRTRIVVEKLSDFFTRETKASKKVNKKHVRFKPGLAFLLPYLYLHFSQCSRFQQL